MVNKSRNSKIKIITFDEDGQETTKYVEPGAKSSLKRKTRTSAPPVPKKYAKIVPAIRRKFENGMPTSEEQEVLFKYFEMKATHELCRHIPSGTRITLCGQEIIFSYEDETDESAKQEICSVLFMEFFSDDGWILKNIKYRDLNDDELWDKFGNRTYNVLRQAVPEAETDIVVDEENPQAQFKAGRKRPVIRAMSELQRDDRDTYQDEQDGADIVTQDDEMEANVVRDIENESPLPKDESVIEDKEKALSDDLLDQLIGNIKDYTNIYDFKAKLMKEFGDHPEILTDYIKQKYRDDPLVERWLVNIFPERIEPYSAISKAKRGDQKAFVEELYWKYDDWERAVAYEAARYEAGRRLVDKPFDEREKILREMVDFYRKYAPSIRRQKIEEYAVTARNTIMKGGKNTKSNKEKLINLLWEYYASQ